MSKPKVSEPNASPHLVTVKVSGRAWDMICAHAEKHRVGVEDVLSQITIDYVPLPKGPPRCGLCNQEGHVAKKCPNQTKMAFLG